MIIGFTGIELPQGKIKFHDQKLITLVNKDNPQKISPYFFEFVLDNFIKSFAIIVPKDKILDILIYDMEKIENRMQLTSNPIETKLIEKCMNYLEQEIPLCDVGFDDSEKQMLIQFYDAKNEMLDFPDHYKKLEELRWRYGKDFPMPKGIAHTRNPFEQYMKYQILFEDKHYGVEVVAVDGEMYVGSTDIHLFPKSDPFKAWTGSLGVLREYRRQGIATALKVKAFEKLHDKGVKQVRTDNEENNPMYKINVALGFTPEPYCYDYQKEI